MSRERLLAEVYNRVPIRKVKIARYYYSFVDVNDDCVRVGKFSGGGTLLFGQPANREGFPASPWRGVPSVRQYLPSGHGEPSLDARGLREAGTRNWLPTPDP